MHGFGPVPELTADGPFAEPWEGKAFVIGALSARIAGGNLHAMRHAIERVPPAEYLVGYWNRWTIGAQTMMEDSGIVTDEEVRARAARLSGQDVPEPPAPPPDKPKMASGGARDPPGAGHPARLRGGGSGAGRRPRSHRSYQAAQVRPPADRDGHRPAALPGLPRHRRPFRGRGSTALLHSG